MTTHAKKRTQIRNVLQQMLDNCDSIEALIVGVEYDKTVTGPMGDGQTIGGFVCSMDCRPCVKERDSDLTPGVEVTTLTLGMAALISDKVRRRQVG